MPKPRFYTGHKDGSVEVFKSLAVPTVASHGNRYTAVVGPYRTKRGAEFMARYGQNNPHCLCVNDAERLAAEQATLAKRQHKERMELAEQQERTGQWR